MFGVLEGNPLAKLIREARLTLLPITWAKKYPKIHLMRWAMVGTIVAALTGNIPLNRLNPFGPGGRKAAEEQMGQTVTSIIFYPLPLTISLTRWLGTESNHFCRFLGVSCDLNPGRNIHFKN